MNRQEFKEKYLTDAFFFVNNESEFTRLQEIGLEFGLTNPIGGKSLIKYDLHDVSKKIAPRPGIKVAKNLTFFPNGKFQQSGFWVRGASYGDPKNFDQFIRDYDSLCN